ncbi:MAG: hypothetical protein GYB67_01775 [Chloroflexi bacterium]|nr:hypothetical protein [Chloroflexota bacterium]
MYPEERVLVGVINRKRDLDHARDNHWYRVPQQRMPRGFHAEYVAFFLSRAFKERNGAIHYFAEVSGVELAYRKDLLPKEADHKRADEVYYRVALGPLTEKMPPITNPTKRPVAFIYTTWDRFVAAHEIRDLYSRNDYYVDRIYHALRNRGIRADRIWEAEKGIFEFAPQLRILCERGEVVASTERGADAVYLDQQQQEDEVLTAILAKIAAQGGPVMINIPSESD